MHLSFLQSLDIRGGASPLPITETQALQITGTMLGLYGAQNAFLQDLTFSRFYNSPVGDNQRLRSVFFMLGMQIFVQCASTWAAASAGGEFASTMGKINTLSFAGWTAYFINSQMQGNKAGFSDSGIKEGLALCALMAILNGLTFFM